MIATFLLEKTINCVLSSDKSINYHHLQNKNINIQFQELTINFIFHFEKDYLYLLTESKSGIDVDIKIKLSNFLEILKSSKVDDLIKENKIAIYGDVKVGQDFFELLKKININWQEIIAKCVDDNNIAKKINESVNQFIS